MINKGIHIVIPIKIHNLDEIRSWCESYNANIFNCWRPEKYHNIVTVSEAYDFYMIEFKSESDKFLFELMYPFDPSEWIYVSREEYE